MRQHFKPILLLALALFTQTISTDDVGILEKEITVASNEALARGRWVPTTRLDPPLLSRLNSVDIACNKARATCHEAIAALFTKDDNSLLKRPFLTALISEYKVTRWDDSGITAITANPVADIEIQINFKARTATRRHQETKARGNQTANPSVVTVWELK